MDNKTMGLSIICAVLAALLVVSLVIDTPLQTDDKIKELQNDNKKLQNDNQKLQGTVNSLQSDNQNLQNTVNGLKGDSTIDNLQKENQKLQNTINGLQDNNQKLQDTINNLQSDNQRLQNSINSLQGNIQELRDITNLAKTTTVANKQTLNQQANSYTYYNFTAQYAGFVFVRIDSSTTNLNFARVRYTSNGGGSPYTITYNQRVDISSSGGWACFHVLPGTVLVDIGNTNLINGATMTVTVDYWY
ncbi:MAG: hypothetical protein LBH62_05655 [Nitrososphaerota archaeon]|nr:hypothetical protein [Nitrososphaerota archaeon]